MRITKNNFLQRQLRTLGFAVLGVGFGWAAYAEDSVEDSLVVLEAEIDTIVQKSERLKSHMTPVKGSSPRMRLCGGTRIWFICI